jgi:putative protein kinase ArgK-like GTPase of G3E family
VKRPLRRRPDRNGWSRAVRDHRCRYGRFFLVILIAGVGDELQGTKRGLIEMADPIAINKADGENMYPAQRAALQYQSAIRLIHPPDSPWIPPVMTCSPQMT